MLGMAGFLLDTPLSPEQLTYANAAKTSGETLLSLIEEILDFSKIEAGKLDLEARPFTITTLVEETVELMAPRAQTKGIEIASYVDERLPIQAVGDVARLRQVLLNLVGNAIKFTEKGGVAVIAEPGDENEVRFEVRDTGIGLKDEDVARIFLDFEQADGSATRKFGGTGLGLAISKRIVERMEGRIAVTSKESVGSTFAVSIPLPAAPDAPRENLPARSRRDLSDDRRGSGNRGVIARSPSRAVGRQDVCRHAGGDRLRTVAGARVGHASWSTIRSRRLSSRLKNFPSSVCRNASCSFVQPNVTSCQH